MPLTLPAVVVMPLMLELPPLGSVKSNVAPMPLRVMFPRLSNSGLLEPALLRTMKDAPGLTVTPLNCWLLVPLLLCRLSAPLAMTSVEALPALLMILFAGRRAG